MQTKPKAGLLPLYLKLYDDHLPSMRETLEAFLKELGDKIAAQGVEIVTAPICRQRPEVKQAMADLVREAPDILMTVHLAYSPSLESVEPLASSSLPLLVLDTTPDASFGRDVNPDRILYNHGIHGVQDLASMLRRHGKPFDIVAGHYKDARFLRRVDAIIRAAHAARSMRSMTVLRIGPSFEGMGDFAVESSLLRRQFGVRVTQAEPQDLAGSVSEVTAEAIEAEVTQDLDRYDGTIDPEAHARSVRVGLGLRRYIERAGFGALSANFLAFDSDREPVDTFPFLELSKAMARGVGYAGEGDVLTAALVGAMLSAFPETTFTEMFCPDWEGDAVFLSHMGEINPAVVAGRPYMRGREWPFSDAKDPVQISGVIRPGPATLVNLAPGPDGSFSLIVAPVEILEDGTHKDMINAVRAWFKPQCSVTEFLETYSRYGGTHHCALVLGDVTEAMASFARGIDVELRVIGGSGD